MNDRLLLLIIAAAVGNAAWAFWHFFGDDAFAALSLIALVGVVADNHRLRRKLRDRPTQ
ncbi:hypothetical protein I4X03_004240 [Massilia sp. R798]|uniref:Uncharacterized protein n=1 Tax=Massilia soli TaxID=2792854 RepID=A0ABS7SJU0_9BURK|nr:hypothetical protein [Massilia soli]